jgi:hypothetical protein
VVNLHAVTEPYESRLALAPAICVVALARRYALNSASRLIFRQHRAASSPCRSLGVIVASVLTFAGGLNGSPIGCSSAAIGSDAPAPRKVNTVPQHEPWTHHRRWAMQPDSYREASENLWTDLAHLEFLRRFEGPNTRASGARNSGRERHTGTP